MSKSVKLNKIIKRAGIKVDTANDNLMDYMKLLIEMDKLSISARKDG